MIDEMDTERRDASGRGKFKQTREFNIRTLNDQKLIVAYMMWVILRSVALMTLKDAPAKSSNLDTLPSWSCSTMLPL